MRSEQDNKCTAGNHIERIICTAERSHPDEEPQDHVHDGELGPDEPRHVELGQPRHLPMLAPNGVFALHDLRCHQRAAWPSTKSSTATSSSPLASSSEMHCHQGSGGGGLPRYCVVTTWAPRERPTKPRRLSLTCALRPLRCCATIRCPFSCARSSGRWPLISGMESASPPPPCTSVVMQLG